MTSVSKLGKGIKCSMSSQTRGILIFPREEEISAVVSTVPVGYQYLRRIVSSIHQSLLQNPR